MKSVIYCHFSFRRPKNTDYGIFAVAFYRDVEGKKLITKKVNKRSLMADHQFVTAIQAYGFALECISESQGKMREAGISTVILVTDNSTLVKWISNPTKNKEYAPIMAEVQSDYKFGGSREIVIGVGLAESRKLEKSYKFCREDLVENAVDITSSEYKSIEEILAENKDELEIVGIA